MCIFHTTRKIKQLLLNEIPHPLLHGIFAIIAAINCGFVAARIALNCFDIHIFYEATCKT
jgi:hypothetical protein